MVPEPSTVDYQRKAWAASLVIRCDDVARLMREGFFWSPDNVVPEEGHIFGAKDARWLVMGYTIGRAWILTDKSQPAGKPPRWVGKLELYANPLDILPTFRLQNLSVRNVCDAVARNGRGQGVTTTPALGLLFATTASPTTNLCLAGGRGQRRRTQHHGLWDCWGGKKSLRGPRSTT
ncbi:hypothetical protein N658DRAFT_497794 [Parathielavia hyrcaniae]|uniref:Uncharacterized protein n=1 Tax=Parathielavia hyrcaniae TaxID=113614 RepID=A0AAN6PY27_9PEZI|nr:hypothetical protein N658DRAFT_497794 [Parathielavia hyrcaniae]